MRAPLPALILPPLLLLYGAERTTEVPANDSACTFHHHVETIDTLRRLPAWLQGFAQARLAPIADRGEPFNFTDVIVRDYPGRRFIRAGHAGSQWFVWYEQGGIAYSKNVLVLELRSGTPTLEAQQSYFRENPCLITDRLLERTSVRHPAAE